MEDKIVNDTVAWVESLAQLRGRNAVWAARTVRESISVSAAEALREKAVDLIAGSETDLLAQIDGRRIAMTSGEVTLQTRGIVIEDYPMWWGEQFLSALANPTLAFLLLIFGFYGILFELNSPGWGVGGTVGIICLILGFFAMAVLPVNYVGLALIGIAMALFVAEAFVPSFGFLTLGGIICLFLGGIMLVDSPAGFERVSLSVLVPVSLATAAISVFLLTRIVKASRTPAQSGAETLLGKAAMVEDAFASAAQGYAGIVRVHGELWRAVSTHPATPGETVTIERRDGLTLHVISQKK
jgi:membrane-bound serine protease (ClpP class)